MTDVVCVAVRIWKQQNIRQKYTSIYFTLYIESLFVQSTHAEHPLTEDTSSGAILTTHILNVQNYYNHFPSVVNDDE